MKICHLVQNYHPSVGGMQTVVKQLSERLVAAGHDLTVLTSINKERSAQVINGVKIIDFAIDGNFVNGFTGTKAEQERFLQALVKEYDIVTIFAAQHWVSDLALANLDKIKAKKVFVPNGFSRLHDPRYKKLYFTRMPAWLKAFDMNIFLSEQYQDCQFAINNSVVNYQVICNGADEREFASPGSVDWRRSLQIANDELLILHVGTHTGEKGHREAMEIFNKAEFNRPALLLLVANDFPNGCKDECLRLAASTANQGKRIVMVDLERPQVVEAFKAADIFLFPSNLESQGMVILEAMAAGLPFLATDVGNIKDLALQSGAGLIIPSQKCLCVRRCATTYLKIAIKKLLYQDFGPWSNNYDFTTADINSGAQLLSDLALDEQQRKKMGRLGREYWSRHATWSMITKQYEVLYKSLL